MMASVLAMMVPSFFALMMASALALMIAGASLFDDGRTLALGSSVM